MGEEIESTVISTFKNKYQEIVRTIVQIRSEAGFTQKFLAEWINVDRRRIIEFETGEKYDINLLLLLCDKLSIYIEINFSTF